MQTEVKESGRFERTLTVQLDDAELAAATKKVAAKMSKNLKIKGFRPGKAPLKIVERHVGAEYLRSEAVQEAIQDVVPEAIDEAGLEPVTVPSISAIRDDSEDGTVEIDVIVTIWPVLDALPDFGDIKIEVEDPAVTDEEVNEQLDALREQFAELVDYEGELAEGDFALIDITVEIDGEVIESAAAKDLMYEIGSHSFIHGIDDLLDGATVGDTVTGDGSLPEGYSDREGEDVTLSIEIKEGRKKNLPHLTDDMVQDATEFDTVDELTDTVSKNINAHKLQVQQTIFRDKVMEHVLDAVDFELPEDLLNSEVEARVQNLVGRLSENSIPISDYLSIIGQEEEDFIKATREDATKALSTRVVLESIAAIENWEVDDDDLVEHVEASHGLDHEEALSHIEESKGNGHLDALTGDILRERALASLVDSAQAVDSDGNAIDLTSVVIQNEQDNTDEDSDAEEVEETSPASDTDMDAPDKSEEQE